MIPHGDPREAMRLGKVILRVGLAVIIIGIIGGALVALSPVENNDMAARQNLLFGLACCFGPSVLIGIPAVVVGRMMRSSAQQDDIGSLYRGWD